MKISVITPVKNGARFLSQTIKSVLEQQGDFNLEYILVDGGSEDQTLALAENLKSSITETERIEMKILSIPDDNMYSALSVGLKEAQGDIICYINSDDFYLPNAFQCVHRLFKENQNVNWISGWPVRYGETGEITRVYIPFQFSNHLIVKGFYGRQLHFIQQESIFWRKSLNPLINHQKLNSYQLAGDFYLWHSFAMAGEKLYIVESLFSGNRMRDGQLSENMAFYRKEFNDIALKPSLCDHLNAMVFKLIDRFAGQSLKRRWSKQRIFYKNKSWLRKD